MKKTLFALAAFCRVTFTQCKDDDPEIVNENWAVGVAGTYVGTAFYNGSDPTATTTFVRLSDKMLNMQLILAGDTFCLDSVPMTSPTFFGIIGGYDECSALTEEAYGIFYEDSVSYTWASASNILVNAVK